MAVAAPGTDESPTQFKTSLSKFILSEESLYTKADLLGSIQQSIIGLFQGKGCTQKSLAELHTEVKTLLATEAGQFLGQYYEERLLKKGMWLLREELKDLDQYDLLLSVADSWNTFYTETLPWLQAIMVDVPMKERTIRQATLMAFRDEMLFKISIGEALKAYAEKSKLRVRQRKQEKDEDDDDADQDDVHAALVQMFLVLLSVNKAASADEKYRRLEGLAAALVSPLVTLSGIYYDGRLNDASTAVTATSVNSHKAAAAGWRRMHASGDLEETPEEGGEEGGGGGAATAATAEVESGGRPRRQSASGAVPTAGESTYGRTLPAVSTRLVRVPRRPSGTQRRLLLQPLLPVDEAGVRGAIGGASASRDSADSASHV